MKAKEVFLRILKSLVFFYYKKIYYYILKYRAEYYTDKVYSSIKIGYGCKCNGKIIITHIESIILGNNVHIGDNAYFFSKGGIIIGDNTHISRNVTIYSSSHQYNGDAVPYDHTHINKPVKIGKNVWIGMNVSIIPGVNIGDGAIIGMGTVVNKDIEPYQIVGSQGLRAIKVRDEKKYNKNIKEQNFGGVNGNILNKITISSFKKTGIEKDDRLFFVVSTGRSGSTTIAKILSQNPKISCKHEPHGQLIRLSTEYAHGEKSKSQVFKELSDLYNVAGVLPSGIYGESDQKTGNLIGLYNQLFPSAYFIWLIRDPFETVISTYSRGWFSDKEFGYICARDTPDVYSATVYSLYRLNGFKCGYFSFDEWKEMHPFERNCWYWYYWNKVIQQQLEVIDTKRWMLIDLHQIKNSLSNIENVFNLNNFNYSIKKTNKAKYDLISIDSQNDFYKEKVEKWCLPLWNDIKNEYKI